MTNQEILTKAIKKAITGGFDLNKWEHHYELAEGVLPTKAQELALILNHDFAKALWGSGTFEDHTRGDTFRPLWQYHLQKMVLDNNPIKYLGENI